MGFALTQISNSTTSFAIVEWVFELKKGEFASPREKYIQKIGLPVAVRFFDVLNDNIHQCLKFTFCFRAIGSLMNQLTLCVNKWG